MLDYGYGNTSQSTSLVWIKLINFALSMRLGNETYQK